MNYKSLRAFALLISCSLLVESYAQEDAPTLSMSLEECLDYAKQNSISLKQAQLQIDNSESGQVSAKAALLPTVSGSVSQGVSAYPIIEDSSLSSGGYTGSYGVDMSMTLYNGGSNRASIQKSVLSSDISQLEYDEIDNSLEIAISEVYVEILYVIEQIEVAKGSLELSEQNEERGKAFLEVGSINEADFAQLQSATASSKYDVVAAQMQLSTLYVSLKQLLEISQEVTLTVKVPELSDDLLLAQIPTVSSVYEAALDLRPEIRSSMLYITSAELDQRVAESGFKPTVSLTAGTGVSHSSSSNYTFSSQMRNNFTTSAGVSLSIPIFSGYVNRSNVAIAKNNVRSAELSLTEAEKNLYQTIESLRNNAVSAQALYSVSEYLLKANLKSMELTQKQYEVGSKSTIELLTEQDNYNQTYQEHIINKYQLILNKALLNYYKTNTIKL